MVANKPPSETVPPIVADLAKLLQCPISALRKIHRSTIEEHYAQAKVSVQDRAVVDLWLASPPPAPANPSNDPTALLAEQARRQLDLTQWPWMAQEESAIRQIQRLEQDYATDSAAAMKALQDVFVAQAKTNSLGELERLVGQYCLYCPDKAYGTYLLMSLLLKLPPNRRVSVHNWLVASDMPRATTEAYGESIAALTVPLYPVSAPLDAQNMLLLQGPKARSSPGHHAPSGAGYLPLQQTGDGSWVTDTTPVEAALANLSSQIAQLQQQYQQLQRRQPRQQPPAQQQQPVPRAGPQQQQQEQRHWNPSQQTFNQGNRRKRQQPRGGNDSDTLWDSIIASGVEASAPPVAIGPPAMPAAPTPAPPPPPPYGTSRPASAAAGPHVPLGPCAGGDFSACLDAGDIDRLLAKATPSFVPESALLWHWQHGRVSDAAVRRTIITALRENGGLATTVAWFRHHWVTILFAAPRGPGLDTHLIDDVGGVFVFDSAPSAAVARDVGRFCAALGFPAPRFRPCPRQLRGSAECGLFALLNAMLLTSGRAPPQLEEVVSLASLRHLSADAAAFLRHGCEIYDLVGQCEVERSGQLPHLLRSHELSHEHLSAARAAGFPPVGGAELAPCSASKQAKRGGATCGSQAVPDIPGPPLCRLHLLLAHTNNETCASLSKAGRHCVHKKVAGLASCPFHVSDADFDVFLASLRTVTTAAQPAIAAPAIESPPETIAVPRVDMEAVPPLPGFVDALSALADPDLEDELLRAAECWLAEANSFSAPTPGPPPISFANLRQYLSRRGPAGHPLALMPWKKNTLLGHQRAIGKIVGEHSPELQQLPLIKGLLQMLTRRKKKQGWRWTSMLRAMAELQGALKNLDVSHGITALHLARSAEWNAAIKGVAARAKCERARIPKSAAASQVLAAIIAEPTRATRILTALTWLCCGRTGDIRQLQPGDIDVSADGQRLIITVTFRAGKTVERRGPYSLHTVLPLDWLSLLGFASAAEVVDVGSWVPLLSSSGPPEVLRCLRRIDAGLENRSLRRGALQALANAGVPEVALLEFSGHTTIAMLRRYLCWGAVGSHKKESMRDAAAALAPSGAGAAVIPGDCSSQRWLQFLGAESPPSSELPLSSKFLANAKKAEDLPLSSKAVAATISTKKAEKNVFDNELRALCHEAFRWLYDDSRYEQERSQAPSVRRGSTAPIRQNARSRLSREDHETQIALHKYESREVLQEQRAEVAAWVRVFSVPQWNKRPPVRRHIGEPTCNDWFRRTPTISFRSRAHRQKIISQFTGGYAASLDLASFFDQFKLGMRVRKYFGVRHPCGNTRLSVLPMGFRPAAQIAQCLTWCLTEGIDDANTRVLTYIDNILILGRTPQNVESARQRILQRAQGVGAVFNSEGLADPPTRTFEFLGEAFDLGDGSAPVLRSLSAKTIGKLQLLDTEWLFPLTSPQPQMSARQLAAVVGLLLFASGSGLPDNDIWHHHAALRFFRDHCGTFVTTHSWDTSLPRMPTTVQADFTQWINNLRHNAPKPIADKPVFSPSDIIFTDASSEGWAALHIDASGVAHVRQARWSDEDHRRWKLHSSACSEPLAIQRALCSCISPRTSTGVLVYSDHQPLTQAINSDCAKAWTYWLLQRTIKTMQVPVRINFVSGQANPADRFSRVFPSKPLEAWEFCNAMSFHEFTHQKEHNEHGNTGGDCDEAEWRQTARNPYRLLEPNSVG